MYYPTRVTAHLPGGGYQRASSSSQQQQLSNGNADTDPLRAGVTAASSDAYYKARLRAGFIDLRNSYNENRPRKGNGTAQRALGATGAGRQQTWDDTVSRSQGSVLQGSPVRALAEHRGLYRSNSSLELDRMDLAEHESALRRDYGSANSLDVISTGSDSFFAMLQDFKNENLDQRAPAPPQMHEVLRGPPVTSPTSPRPVSSPDSGKLPNGNLVQPDDDSADGSHSPRLRHKSQKSKDRKPRNKSVVSDSGGGLFKKLRGKGEGEVSVKSQEATTPDSETCKEERRQSKALVHYDCQSICVNFSDVIKRKNSLNRRKNTTTGASAASGVRNLMEEPGGDEDYGDNKANDLVLNCSYFRNELGGEEERTIALNRFTERVGQFLQSKNVDISSLNHRPACNGVAIMDTSIQPNGMDSDPPVLSHKGLIVEHVDHGALYYRNYFYDCGKHFFLYVLLLRGQLLKN